MPRKRKQSSAYSLLTKQKKNLTTRLIQISMKVDDHVYKNIAISVDDAKSYFEELMTYESQCQGDMRSMQVIEKLTRCMQAIIAENKACQDTEALILNSIYSQNYCVSPTYSDIDDNNVPADVIRIPDDRRKIMATDLTTDDSADIGPVKISTEVEIHRAMSNLSIRDTQDVRETANDFSQSILQDFENERYAREDENCNNLVESNKHTQSNKKTESKEHTAGVNQSTSINNIITEREKVSYDRAGSIANTRNLKYKNINLEINKTTPNSKETASTENTKIKATIRKRRTKQEMLSYANKAVTKAKHRTTGINADKKKSAEKKQNSDLKNALDVCQNTHSYKNKETEIYLLSCNNVSHSIHKENKFTLEPNIVQRKGICNKEIPIYKKNVENDLSWIENIRYIREVSSNEFDPKYIDISDDFWENCNLPSFWDDNDFVL